jgi:hypothetical protein
VASIMALSIGSFVEPARSHGKHLPARSKNLK